MKYDIAVIGSGPGGYVCAIRLAQLGMKVALIEKYNKLGGTCLNVGCIPSKALLDSSEHYYEAAHGFGAHGIKVEKLAVDFKTMVNRKQQVVDETVAGVDFLMKKNKIEVVHGMASFTKDKSLEITTEKGKKQKLEADKYIIATGSKPFIPDNFNYDKKRVISSTEALVLPSIPKKLLVVGGGVIGLELGSVYARLGTEVTVVEYQDRITPTMDKDCSRELMKVLKKQGINFHIGYSVEHVENKGKSVELQMKKKGTETMETLKADYCLVAIGRKPFTTGLGLENIGVKTNAKGMVEVDDYLQTNVPNVYAIGDVIRGAMLAHKAEEEGVFVAEHLAGQIPHINYNLIPSVIYTWPEVASVGQTEEALKAAGIPIKKGKFNLRASGRARASGDVDGFIKVLAHAETDEVLGVHMVSARAADLIMEAVTIMEFKGSAEDIGRMCHPHPTYSESIKEAALDVDGRAIHM